MAKPSDALRSLRNLIYFSDDCPVDQPITWGALTRKLDEAIEDVEQREYEEYMGEDL